jgi:hypothetical protein
MYVAMVNVRVMRVAVYDSYVGVPVVVLAAVLLLRRVLVLMV